MYCYIDISESNYIPSTLVVYSIEEVKLSMNTRWFINASVYDKVYRISPGFQTLEDVKDCLKYLLISISAILYDNDTSTKLVSPKKLIDEYIDKSNSEKAQ